MPQGSPPRPEVIRDPEEARRRVLAARAAGKRSAVVPTMGALHEGHLSLVAAANADCQFTAVTIFVNPTQFAPHEDLTKYPRQLEADLELLARHAVDFVFVPTPESMYPEGFSTYVQPPAVGSLWEGASRPEHFRGVTTVVLKLFNILPTDTAIFGQKDFQQAAVIEHMVRDLNVPVEIQVAPIVRDADGLALSSRNVYLSAEERRRALGLSRALRKVKELVDAGERDAAALNQAMSQTLADYGIDRIDYAVVVDRHTLEPLTTLERSAVALIAAHAGSTRLIDNQLLEPRTE